MDTLQVSGIAAFTLVSLAFYFMRKMLSFNIFSILVVTALVIAIFHFQLPLSPEMLVLLSGLILYWFGLLIVRVMLQRSVSLHLLLSYFWGSPAETIQEEVSNRFKDALFFKLAQRDGEIFKLTFFGKFIASIVALFYFVVRIER